MIVAAVTDKGESLRCRLRLDQKVLGQHAVVEPGFGTERILDVRIDRAQIETADLAIIRALRRCVDN